MKVALIFLSLFVAASYQQAYYPYWPFYPQSFYAPYYNPITYQVPAAQEGDQVHGGAEARQGDEANGTGTGADAVGRVANNLVFTLGNALFRTSTTTKTSWTTSVSTAVTASVITCIGKSFFSAASPTACRRRRAIFEDSGLDPELLAPSPKDEIVPSVVPEEVKREVEPEILSSQDQVDADPVHKAHKRQITTVTTVTVTSTSIVYNFTATSYTKTLNILGTAATSNLLCLPAGVVTCT